MIAEPLQFVVDASVGIKSVMPEELSDKADQLFAALGLTTLNLAVPDLFYIECANVLAKYVRRFKYSPFDAGQDIAQLCALALNRFDTASMSLSALELANEFKLSAYDACYVALAQQLSVPLITADERLVNTLARSVHKLIWLGDFALPKSEE